MVSVFLVLRLNILIGWKKSRMRRVEEVHAACHQMLREKDRKLQEWQFKFETLKSLYDEVLKTLLTKMNRPATPTAQSTHSSHSAAVLYLIDELRRIAVAPTDIDRIKRGVVQRLEDRKNVEEVFDSLSKRCQGSATDAGARRGDEKRRFAAESRQSTQATKQKQLRISDDIDASELVRKDVNIHKSESSLFGINSLPTEYLSNPETVSLHLPSYSKLLRLDKALFKPPKKPANQGKEEEPAGRSCESRAIK